MSLAEPRLVERPHRRAQRHEAVADALDVDLLDRIDEPEEVDSLLGVELPDKAEVEEDDLLGRRVGQDVARVRIAVEEAVHQHLLDHRADEHRAERRRIEACLAQLIRLRDLDPVDELHGDDPLSGQVVVDGRDVDLGEAGHAVREAPRMVSLVPVVELLEDACRELVDDAAEPDLAGHRDAAFGDRRQLLHDAEVGLRLGLDPGPLDLDCHERPVMQRRLVDLRGGRGREGHRVERREQLFGRGAELLSDDDHDVVVGERAQPRSGAWTARVTHSGDSTSLRLAAIWPIFT